MKYNLDKSRMGMLIFLGVALGALWLIVAYGFYKESERAKYDVRVSPGAVSYGTHSTALMPVTISPMHKGSIPMLSGAAIRSYAHSGHATMPTLSSKGVVYTTSSAKVKSIGSGMGNGGIMTTSNSSGRSSSRGIQYGGGTVAMPSIAMVSASSMSRATANAAPRGMRKAKMTLPDPGSGDEGDWFDGGSDGWFFYDEDGWRPVQVGDSQYFGEGVNRKEYKWTGSAWVPATEWEPDVPVGPLPWLFMLLLAVGYGLVRSWLGRSRDVVP